MFKKLITFTMVFSFFIVQANAASNAGLKAAFDELNYSLSVEWDQKDKTFYTEQMKTFTAEIHELQAKGLTNQQLIEFVKAEVKNEKVAKDLETAFNMISINKMSAEDASQYMVETMKRSYSVGASYQGEVAVLAAVGLLFIVAAIVVGAMGSSYSGGGSSCVDTYVCDTSCYNDYYYGYTCYDDCYYACY